MPSGRDVRLLQARLSVSIDVLFAEACAAARGTSLMERPMRAWFVLGKVMRARYEPSWYEASGRLTAPRTAGGCVLVCSRGLVAGWIPGLVERAGEGTPREPVDAGLVRIPRQWYAICHWAPHHALAAKLSHAFIKSLRRIAVPPESATAMHTDPKTAAGDAGRWAGGFVSSQDTARETGAQRRSSLGNAEAFMRPYISYTRGGRRKMSYAEFWTTLDAVAWLAQGLQLHLSGRIPYRLLTNPPSSSWGPEYGTACHTKH